MADETTLEQKRAQAKRYRGVTYDSRIDRFTCSIMVRGERRYLGSFLTPGEASLVYEQARENDPIERPRKGTAFSIRSALIAFEEEGQRGANRKLLPGLIFTAPDGQRFRLEGMSLKNKRNRYEWTSRCKICGVLFDQHSPVSLRSVTGMNRTCETHRGQLGKMETHDWPDPVEWQELPAVSHTTGAAAGTFKKANEALPDEWNDKLKSFARRLRGVSSFLVTNEEIIERYAAYLGHAGTDADTTSFKTDSPTPEELEEQRVVALATDFPAPWRENKDFFAFALEHRKRFPGSALYEIHDAFWKQTRQRAANAREEDMEIQARSSNEDLV